MDIVDAQVHINTVGIRSSIEAMNTLGIQAALFHEHGGRDADSNPIPHHKLANGVVRPVGPLAEASANRYPDRLQYLLQVDPRDPEIDTVVGLLRSSPNARALRTCVAIPSEREAFAAGTFRPAFAAASKHGFPLFVLTIGCAPLLRPYLEEFPDATVIVDHCGMPATPAEFDDVLDLARFKNLALKWSHMYFSFPTTAFPYPEWDPFLKAAVERFGPERMMWASDFTEMRGKCTWAEVLFYLRSTKVLSDSDREWILGRTVRTLLKWPKPE
jgi:L-fuconolactonase